MTRTKWTLAAVGISSIMACSAFAQGAVQRDGTDAGGPANSMRAAAEGSGSKSMTSRKMKRSKMTTGSVSRRKAEKSGTDAGGPRTQGIPGQVR